MSYTKLPVLLYHSISQNMVSNEIDSFEFEKQISYLKNNNYESVSINQIKPNTKKQIILTFDDGYKDIISIVLPILKKYNFKAICFIVSNHIGQYNLWDVNNHNYKKKELLNKTDIFEWLKNGMMIGSHSHNHLDLTKLDKNSLEDEVSTSKKILEDTFSTSIVDFCYPYGKVNSNSYVIVKNNYNNAYTTNRSRYFPNKHDPFLIPRIDMGQKLNRLKMFLKLKTFYEDIKFKKNDI